MNIHLPKIAALLTEPLAIANQLLEPHLCDLRHCLWTSRMKEVHGAAARHQGWALGLWLGVAILAHILVALFGVLNRWLQVCRGR